MEAARKGILITTIVNYLAENIKNKNHKLAEENLYSEQEEFDYGDMFLKLAFMEDSKIERIASLIVGSKYYEQKTIR